MKLKMKKVAFEGWKNCVEIASGDFRLIVTTDVGPRIIGGFLGKNGKNIFHVDPKLAGKSGGDQDAVCRGFRGRYRNGIEKFGSVQCNIHAECSVSLENCGSKKLACAA